MINGLLEEVNKIKEGARRSLGLVEGVGSQWAARRGDKDRHGVGRLALAMGCQDCNRGNVN